MTIPRFLCVPVIKTKGQQVYPISEAADDRDHLACYEVSLHSHSELVDTRSQFTGIELDGVATTAERYLCVPSKKIYEEVPSLAPWGIATLGLFMLLTLFWVAQCRVRYGRPA